MIDKRVGLLTLSAVVLLPGCASIVDGKNQPISVDTRSKGTAVAGTNCKLTNDKGIWYVTAPGTTTVQRSYEDMQVHCERAGYAPAVASFKSSTKGMAFGNILFGGLIGIGVDMASGSAYDYPSPMTVEMGDLGSLVRVSMPEVAAAAPTGTAVAPNGGSPNGNIEAARAAYMLSLTGCQTTMTPRKFKEKDGVSYYEAFCSDNRLVHALCSESDCRLRTSKD